VRKRRSVMWGRDKEGKNRGGETVAMNVNRNKVNADD
jgi:hypothetical protein